MIIGTPRRHAFINDITYPLACRSVPLKSTPLWLQGEGPWASSGHVYELGGSHVA